jgi:hypothetical protein
MDKSFNMFRMNGYVPHGGPRILDYRSTRKVPDRLSRQHSLRATARNESDLLVFRGETCRTRSIRMLKTKRTSYQNLIIDFRWS